MPEGEVKKYVGRGGWRGGGRPKVSPEKSRKRPNNGMRAWPDEWALIKRFQKCVVKDKTLAEKYLEDLEYEAFYYKPDK
jgi:hypothetical protein